jgi:tetratricopeptide (TPR) repeat protein
LNVVTVILLGFLTSCSSGERREKEAMDHLAQSTQYANMGELEAALREWQIADRTMPEDALVWVDRSKLEHKMGHADAAVEAAYKSIAYTKPPETPAYAYTIHLLLEAGKSNEAQKLIERALNDQVIIESVVPYVDVVECKVQLLMESGNIKDAIAVCDQALKLLPQFDNPSRSRMLKIKAECESKNVGK